MAGQTRRGNKRWWVAAALATALIGSLGCNPLSIMGYLSSSWGPNTIDPPCPLTYPDKESKVVIFCTFDPESPPNLTTFPHADQEVAQMLTTVLRDRFKENGDKVKLAPASKVISYQSQHSDWVLESKKAIGKHFDADLIVFLELKAMTLSEGGSLLKGHVEIGVKVYDVHEPEGEMLKFTHWIECKYPSTEFEDSFQTTKAVFREKFLNRIAKDLAHLFAAYPPRDKMDLD
jgi:hypothetical protein